MVWLIILKCGNSCLSKLKRRQSSKTLTTLKLFYISKLIDLTVHARSDVLFNILTE